MNPELVNILTTIPIVILGVCLIVVFFYFLVGAVLFLFFSNKDEGKKIVMRSLYFFIIILVLFLVFSAASYVIKISGVLNPPIMGEFPNSPAQAFPPAPIINK
jgi:hypothetical protein